MAVLTDQNLVNYKKYIDDLETQTQALAQYLSGAERAISSGTGSTFRTEYAKGKKASTNIQTIIDILDSLRKDLVQLVIDAKRFYTTSYNASKYSKII